METQIPPSPPRAPKDYVFFDGTSHAVTDGPNVYYDAFDGNFDTSFAALGRIGYGQMPIVIGEVGWPTDEALSANLTAARAFNQGLINHVLSSKGTPLRPGAKYAVNLGLGNRLLKNAGEVEYLPSRCYSGSCNAIGANGNVSYAFSSYYQLQKQDSKSCDFDGLGMITFLDP
ncbi:X8 domain [Dillenia turbinata]|uniref:X8 domain n=1 Tax=Dillenia turbinata TaxID=194707 RepID=A0AAN8ULV5_9MAGN